MESDGGRPRAVFMAFGTQGDVYPIAAIAAALACDQRQYDVILITHSAHKTLGPFLESRRVHCIPVPTPPVLSFDDDSTDVGKVNFSLQKKAIQIEHRKECLSTIEKIFGDSPSLEGDFILINFFALEGWSLAELFQIRCVIAAPYVVPYSAPSSFERRFQDELPLLYRYLKEAPVDMVCWNDVIHWMWPLFTEDWGSWRSNSLKLSAFPFMDPVTDLPLWHLRDQSPLLLYGVSKEIVECPGYWPANIHVCGFWFLPMDWQFSCSKCREASLLYYSKCLGTMDELCSSHADLQHFTRKSTSSCSPMFVGLSSVGRSAIIYTNTATTAEAMCMGFLKNPRAFLLLLKAVIERTDYKFILFSSGYEPLDAVIGLTAKESFNLVESHQISHSEDCTLLFDKRLFCFSGVIPYSWLFPRCAAVIHHGGSGSTAAAIQAGVPQIVCPFMLDQFYWAERMHWLGLAPEPLQKSNLVPENDDVISIEYAAHALIKTIHSALSPDVKARASEMAARISLENGIGEALKALRKDVIRPKDTGEL